MNAMTQASVKSRNFTIGNPSLSDSQRIALEALKQIASEGRRATLAELSAATGIMYQTGGVPRVLNELERKGYITRQVFQRGMIICFPDGTCTAPPENMAPHHSFRGSRSLPTPAIQPLRQRMPSTSQEIEHDAKERNLPLHEHLMDLVYIGHHGYRAEKEGEIQ